VRRHSNSRHHWSNPGAGAGAGPGETSGIVELRMSPRQSRGVPGQ
jgi:hypothetical protein